VRVCNIFITVQGCKVFMSLRKTTVYASSSSFMERTTTSTDMLHVLNPPMNKDETEEHTTYQQEDRPHFNIRVLKFIGSSLPCQVVQWDSWLRHYNTRQKVAGLIPR
jgi:hypothetical protein